MGSDVVLGFVRHALTALGGFMVAQGMVDEAAYVEVPGSVAVLVGFVWSWWVKRK